MPPEQLHMINPIQFIANFLSPLLPRNPTQSPSSNRVLCPPNPLNNNTNSPPPPKPTHSLKEATTMESQPPSQSPASKENFNESKISTRLFFVLSFPLPSIFRKPNEPTKICPQFWNNISTENHAFPPHLPCPSDCPLGQQRQRRGLGTDQQERRRDLRQEEPGHRASHRGVLPEGALCKFEITATAHHPGGVAKSPRKIEVRGSRAQRRSKTATDDRRRRNRDKEGRMRQCS